MLSMSFDSASLKRIQSLEGFEQFLEPKMTDAMNFIVAMVQSDAQAYMYGSFKNAQGPLEDAVQTSVPNMYTGIISNDMPYAWRREEGFDGADSLGRNYHDSGIHYFANTLKQDKPIIWAELEKAVQFSLDEMGA
jgi:hypothetical protein